MQQSATTHLKRDYLVDICILGQQLYRVSWHGILLKITTHVFRCVCVYVLINITFSPVPFEMNSLCTLGLPEGISLIEPNT